MRRQAWLLRFLRNATARDRTYLFPSTTQMHNYFSDHVNETISWRLSIFLASRHYSSARSGSSSSAAGAYREEQKGPRLNRAITDRFMRVVTDEGHQVLSRQDALLMAEKAGLDLVEVDGKSSPVVCKLMDYKKEKYVQEKKEKERKKKQVDILRLADLKEVRVNMKIEQKDLEMKCENGARLLQRGHKLKCVVQLPIQKLTAEEATTGVIKVDPRGPEILQKMIDMLESIAKLEIGPRIERHRVWAILKPK